MNKDKAYSSELGFKNKLGRLFWGFTASTVFRFSPRVCHGWRRWILRLFGANVGAGSKIYPSVRIWAPWNLEVGEHAIIGDRADIYSVAKVSIGTRAVVSQDACLCAATHETQSGNFKLITKPITIGAGAWVAARAFIGPGVNIGEKTVVGACGVVFKDIPQGETVVGNPAKILAK